MKKALTVIHPHAAGIDIGSRSFFVDAGEDEIKIFPTYTEGCYGVRDYLLKQKVTTVAMESTGVYWVILYAVLEEAGFDVFLVNGRSVRNVPGRKSDVKDCQWLRQLHTYGLLTKSFIPDDKTRVLRSYMRLRQDHIRASATQINLMQKALTQMNIRLAEAINDITGASGMRMIEKIMQVRVKHHNPASMMFRNMAQGLLNSKHIAIGAFGRRIRSKRGSAIAIKAIARKLACYYYRVMTKGEEFLESGIVAYEQHLRDKQRKYLERMALKLNLQLVSATINATPCPTL
jgi:hypothetical protein